MGGAEFTADGCGGRVVKMCKLVSLDWSFLEMLGTPKLGVHQIHH
jgi:hypothetical protein